MRPTTLALASAFLASCGGDAGTKAGEAVGEAVDKAPESKKPEARTPEVKAPEVEPPVVKAPTPDGLTPVPLPEWVGFPADPGKLQAAIDARDAVPLRQHAWRLFAGINQRSSADDPRPRWWTWSTTTQLFEQPAGPPTLTAMTGHRHMARTLAVAALASPPAPGTPDPDSDHTDECFDAKNPGRGVIFYPGPTYALPMATVKRFGLDPRCADPTYFLANTDACALKDGTHFQSNGDILVATESYSEPGADRIATLRYNDTATLQGLLAAGTRLLPRLATQQVTTKHMYWPVKAEGRSALPVFREPPRDRWCQYNGYEHWAEMVAVEPGGAAGKGAVDFLFGVYDRDGKAALPTRHATVDVHPLDEFYAQQIDQARWDALDVKDQMILDAASQWAHGEPFEPGDHVVTVAMHIITREIPQWTLQSAWWSDQPDAGPYAADRPELPRARGPWQHYLMTVEDGITREPGGAALPPAFNPFIELAATHPIATNCRNCHIRASWPAAASSYLKADGPGPLANIGVDDEIFAGLLLTDFQWVIADRVKASK